MTFTRHDESTLTIDLSSDEVTRLRQRCEHIIQTRMRRPNQTGGGGFQNLNLYWLEHLQGSQVVITEYVWIERTIRYTTRYGDGGFQNTVGGRARYGVYNV